MPQPVNLNSTGGQDVLTRPKCLIQIAAVVCYWAYVEDSLALMFSASMGSHTLSAGGGAQVTRNWPALVAMQELTSIHMRLNIIEKALVPLLPQDLQGLWRELKRDLLAGATERNTCAHTAWTTNIDYPEDLISPERDGSYMRYSEKDFAQILEHIKAINFETHELLRKVLAAQREGTARTISI
jgi:hypothetical protein